MLVDFSKCTRYSRKSHNVVLTETLMKKGIPNRVHGNEKNLFHYLIFPFKFCPHGPEFNLCTRRRHNVIHDVDVNIIENHNVTIGHCTRDIVYDVAENDPIFSRRDFNVCFDAKNFQFINWPFLKVTFFIPRDGKPAKVHWGKDNGLWSFYKLEISKCC